MEIEQCLGNGWGGGKAAMFFVYFALIHENRISIRGENEDQKKETDLSNG